MPKLNHRSVVSINVIRFLVYGFCYKSKVSLNFVLMPLEKLLNYYLACILPWFLIIMV